MGKHRRDDDAEGRPEQPIYGRHVDTERQPSARTNRGGRLVDLLPDELYTTTGDESERGGRYDQR